MKWYSIPQFENLYSVNEEGQVLSHERTVKKTKGRTGGATQPHNEQILGGSLHTGYVRYGLRKNKKTYPKFAHILVWEAIKGKIPEFYQIDHIDGNKQNNNLSNLQCIHRRDHHKISTARGQKATYGGKLKKSEVIKIKSLYEKNPDLTQQELANMFGVTQATISSALTGRTYKELDLTSPTYKRAYKEGFTAGYEKAINDINSLHSAQKVI